MELSFTKMHGLGNDFIVIDALEKEIALTAGQIKFLADRHFGVGCDQVLLLEPGSGGADVRYRIFNAGGGEVEQCGNGARCIGAYLWRNGIVKKDVIKAETSAGVIDIYRDGAEAIRVNMGIPRFEPAAIPLLADSESPRYSIALPDGAIQVYALSMGNPHAILLVDDVAAAAVERLGPQVQAHHLFPNSVNVGFMQIVDRRHIQLRVYERGVGETLACGSGACAAVVAGRRDNRLDAEVDAGLKGGHLSIRWEGAGAPVWMTGPAVTVYQGQMQL